MTDKLREVTQDEWADHLNTESCYPCEPSPDVMEHREWGTCRTVGRVVYGDDGSRKYYIPLDSPAILQAIHERLSHDMAYRYSVRQCDTFNMQIVLRAWGYAFCEDAAALQIAYAGEVSPDL